VSLSYIDVCSGISAPTMAWKPLGWCALCFAEIEPAPRAVLAHHYPDVPLQGDFTEIEGNEYGPVDLVVGGTPCQDFSVAGLRAGLDGARGNLTLQFGRLARRSRARWMVWENVPGVFSSNAGRDFGAVLASFAGYPVGTIFAPPPGGWRNSGVIAPAGPHSHGLAWRVLDAQHFGVPQRRRRVFVVGYLGDWRRAAAVLFERHSLSGHPAPRREAGSGVAVGALAGTSPGGGWRIGADEAAAGQLVTAFGGNDTRGPIDVSTALKSHGGPHGRLDFESETFVAHCFDARQQDVIQHGDRTGPLDTDGWTHAVAFTQNSRSEVREIGGDGQIVGALAADVGAQQQSYLAFNITPSNSNKDFNARESQRAQALTAGGNRPSARGGDLITDTLTSAGDAHSGFRDEKGLVVTSAVRRLTPRECERLQGFPDDFTLVPNRGKPMADGPRYKMLGNSMAVPVLRWIGERVAMVELLAAQEQAA
jgi:DNA (cytosine-5)-methyltransferase 1